MIRKVVRDMSAYVPGEQVRGLVKLNSNENPYPPSPKVLKILKNTGDPRLYPDPTYASLRTKIAKRYGFSKNQVIIGNGSDEVLDLVSRVCGGEIAYIWPSFSMFEIYAKLNGKPVKVPLEKDCSLDPVKVIRTKANLVLIASPNNPTGNQFPIESVKEICKGIKGTVVIDEAYADFADYTCIPLVKKYRNLIVTRTFSKSFSLAGMRVGFGIGSAKMIDFLNRIRSPFNVNRVSACAAEAAFDDYGYMRKNSEKIKKSRENLYEKLQELGLNPFPSQSNFIFMKMPNPKKLTEELKKRGVLVRCFDQGIRISVGTEKENAILIKKLKGALNV